MGGRLSALEICNPEPIQKMTTLTDYNAKVEAIREWRVAKQPRHHGIECPENAPCRVTLRSTAGEFDFTLDGNELASLLSDFADISSVRDLFVDLL